MAFSSLRHVISLAGRSNQKAVWHMSDTGFLGLGLPATWPSRRYSLSSDTCDLEEVLTGELEAMKQAGTYKDERIITTPQGPLIRVQNSENGALNFCANNYLGLSNHPKLINAAKKALDLYGFGLSSVRFICGTQNLHKELETRLSEFHGTDDTILYPSCFDANGGFFESIFSEKDTVISDELNHASIIDGIRLCKSRRLRFRHLDMHDLEIQLKESQGSRFRVIVTDGVFSMDGDVAPLREICQLAESYNSLVFVDDCHATGFIGSNGRGSAEYSGVHGKVHFTTSTLGKALGGATGGYTTGQKSVINVLRQKSRPYLFSNTLAPPVAAASIAALGIITENPELRSQLNENTEYFRKEMSTKGFKIRHGNHPIVPIILGDARLAHKMAKKLLEKGVYVIGFSYPVVPKGAARIRVQISASHTKENLDKAISSFSDVGLELGVIN